MARRRTTRRKKTTRRRTTARRAAPRRRTTRKKTTRRRRRRNPAKKFAIKDTLFAGVAGIGAAGAAYGLKGQNLAPNTQAGILAAGGLILGGLISAWNKPIGAGLAGGGVALGAKMALESYMAKQAAEQAKGMGRIPNYAVRKFGRTPQHPAYHHLPMGAVQADLGAVQADLGGYEAQLTGFEAELI